VRYVLTALLALAACSPEPTGGNSAPANASAPATMEPPANEADAIADALANNGMPPLPKTVATPTRKLPAEFVGVWTADKAGNCAPGTELRIEIAPDRITFHESVAKVESVVATWPEGYGVDVRMTGEGQTERRSFDLIPRKDGSLTRSEAPYPDITYTRCKGQP
jgi:hypothetical protein